MALQHLRSSTANKRPLPSGMTDGQLAINTNLASPGVFVKDSNSDLVKIGPVHVGSGAPNATPASGGATGNSKGETWLDTASANPVLKVWDGSAWQTVQPVVSGTVVSTANTGTVTSTMIADGTIVNADINASAGIVYSKLALSSGIVNTDISASAAIAHSKLASVTGGNILMGNASNVATSTAVTGDVLISNAGVTSIASAVIVDADVNASAAIAHSKLASITAGSVLLGNASNVPTATALSGDMTVNSTGVTAISAGVIVDADINASAAIAHSKLANITAGSVLLGNASNVPTATALSGDVTVNSTGVTAIGAGVIVNADINASAAIADTKLATISTAGKVSNSATTATNANTASAIVARDASGNFAAGTITAALSGNASTATQVLQTVTGTTSAELVRGNMADNDLFRILVGGTATNAGFAEIATADDGSEPIHVRQYSGVFTTLVRTATLLDGSGNTSFPGTVTAPTFSGALNGNASTVTNGVYTSGNQSIGGDKSFTGTTTLGNVTFGFIVNAQNAATGEGGEFQLAKPSTGSLAGNVVFDINTNSLRIFENGGTTRGVTLDITGCGSQSALLHANNYNSYAPTLTGTGASGTWSINITGSASSNVLKAGDTMTGALVHPLGAVGTPSITFTSDTDTGIWSPGADTIAFSEGGAEAMRIDSSARLLVGTNTATNNNRLSQKLSIVNTGDNTYGGMSMTSYVGTTAANSASILDFQRSRGTTDGSLTAVANGDALGYIMFRGADGTNFDDAAHIRAEVDNTPGANDMPGRLILATSSDGSNTATERLRISSTGLHTINLSAHSGPALTTTSPAKLYVASGTYTDTATPPSTTNSAHAPINAFASPTFNSTSTLVTYSSASTVYIQDAPIAGSNITITRRYALYIDNGQVGLPSTSASAPAITFGTSITSGINGPASNVVAVSTSSSERVRITSQGNMLLGGTVSPTSAVASFCIFNGTAPTASVANGVILYAEDVSASSELKVRDEAGNITTLSPHNFDLIPEGPSEDMAWSYYSERDGKRINVDMLKAIRLLEQLSGEKLVYSS